MRRKRFAVLVAALVVVASALYGLGVMGASAEANDSDGQEFRWLAGAGDIFPGVPLCVAANPPCPDEAAAANGHIIDITGEGTLSIEDGEPEDVDGGGSYVIDELAADGSLVIGTWEAEQLLMFDSYGPALLLPPALNAGRALILIRLAGGIEADGILEIGCRLAPPGEPGGGIPGTIEGIRLLISGGQNFNVPTDPTATLFIDITDSNGDD